MTKMKGAILPGNSTVEIKEFEIPTPGHGEVLLKMKSSTICGSDIRCIYLKHVGKGPERYILGTIAGHEPAGEIVEIGKRVKKFKEGDPVMVYHISGCGLCKDCRKGYMISCTGGKRAAYGWQRDGGMAEYLLTEEKDLIFIPAPLGYSDGAQVACGFGTAYEALKRMNVGGDDATLVVGLGPVGMASLMLARAMGSHKLIGVNTSKERIEISMGKSLADRYFCYDNNTLDKILDETDGRGVEKAVDCSGSEQGRRLAIQATARYGEIALVGEGGKLKIDVSQDLIHGQKTIHGSWVSSTWLMEELLERLVYWGVYPDELITHKYPLEKAGEAYSLAASKKCGKVEVCFDEEMYTQNKLNALSEV